MKRKLFIAFAILAVVCLVSVLALNGVNLLADGDVAVAALPPEVFPVA